MSMRQLKISKSITNRESQSLEKYLQEIGKVDLITPEEEVKLAIRIKQGDLKALDRLTKANLRFVVSVAKQYQNQGLSLPDLINEGNLGLIKAAQRFDETRGFKFISYAVWWIRQSILQALAEQSRIVRLPLNKVGLTNRINKAYQQLEQEFEREPSAEELADLLVATHQFPDLAVIAGTPRCKHRLAEVIRAAGVDVRAQVNETGPGMQHDIIQRADKADIDIGLVPGLRAAVLQHPGGCERGIRIKGCIIGWRLGDDAASSSAGDGRHSCYGRGRRRCINYRYIACVLCDDEAGGYPGQAVGGYLGRNPHLPPGIV